LLMSTGHRSILCSLKEVRDGKKRLDYSPTVAYIHSGPYVRR